MEFIQKLIQKDFLFTQTTPSDFRSLLSLIVFFGGLIILTIFSLIIFRKINPVTSRIKAKVNSWMFSLGLTGLAIVFFRWQQLGFLSKNFILELLGVIWFIWLIIILVFVIRKYPKEAFDYQDKQRIAKFLPKPRKFKNNRKNI
jgi:hypothetical protein